MSVWTEIKNKMNLLNANKADLVGGVIPTSQIPALAINDTFTATSQSAMLALNAQRGDVAVRTDLTPSRVYILAADAPGVLGNWREITAAGSVQTVAGQSGVVVLGKADVGLPSVDNTSDANKPVSLATQTALNEKVNGLGGVKAVKYAATLPAWTPADEGTLMFVPNA